MEVKNAPFYFRNQTSNSKPFDTNSGIYIGLNMKEPIIVRTKTRKYKSKWCTKSFEILSHPLRHTS